LYFEEGGALMVAVGSATTQWGDAALAVVPLSIEGRILGALALRFAEPRAFAEEDRDILLAMASQAAQAIERARLYDAARSAVEVRDNFIAIASHDLRSPLAALLGQAQLLERRAYDPQPEQISRRARLIVEQTQRLNRMVGTLLDLSRIQSGQLMIEVAPLDLAALGARVVGEIQPTLNRHTLELVGTLEGLVVAGDEVRLEHVLYNLIGNAVKYSPNGGIVTVSIERQNAQACVAVTDHGIGIPADALPHLFERYFRAANAGVSGMGIGLYAVREILALHGGSITVISEEGLGSTFTFALPIAEDRA
jgi:signal transduction histidine kinase